MAAEAVKNRQRTPRRYLAEDQDDDDFSTAEPTRRESKLKRKTKTRKEAAPATVPAAAAFTSTQSESPSGAAARKERLARRSLEEVQFQEELEKAVRLSLQGGEAPSSTDGSQESAHQQPQAASHKTPEEEEDFIEVVEVSQDVKGPTAAPSPASRPASAAKKRKLGEGWIVHKKEEDGNSDEEEDMPVVKRSRRPGTAAIIVDSDSEEVEKENGMEGNARVDNSSKMTTADAPVSMSQASTQSPPASHSAFSTATSAKTQLEGPAFGMNNNPESDRGDSQREIKEEAEESLSTRRRSGDTARQTGRNKAAVANAPVKSSGKDNKGSDHSDSELENGSEEDEEEFVPKARRKTANVAKPKGRIKSAPPARSSGKENLDSDSESETGSEDEEEEEFVPKKGRKKGPTAKQKGGDKTAAASGMSSAKKPTKPLLPTQQSLAHRSPIVTAVAPSLTSRPMTAVVPAANATASSAASPLLSVSSSPLVAVPLSSRLSTGPPSCQVKMPAWTPPGRLQGRDISTTASSSSTHSPSIGVRVGLSRNIKLAKPLHSSVRHVP